MTVSGVPGELTCAMKDEVKFQFVQPDIVMSQVQVIANNDHKATREHLTTVNVG